MKRGEKRPRKWSNQAPTGRMGEMQIRSLLLSVTRAMRDKHLTHKQRLEYLRHAERLQNELRLVTQEKLRRQVEELQAAEENTL